MRCHDFLWCMVIARARAYAEKHRWKRSPIFVSSMEYVVIYWSEHWNWMLLTWMPDHFAYIHMANNRQKKNGCVVMMTDVEKKSNSVSRDNRKWLEVGAWRIVSREFIRHFFSVDHISRSLHSSRGGSCIAPVNCDASADLTMACSVHCSFASIYLFEWKELCLTQQCIVTTADRFEFN